MIEVLTDGSYGRYPAVSSTTNRRAIPAIVVKPPHTSDQPLFTAASLQSGHKLPIVKGKISLPDIRPSLQPAQASRLSSSYPPHQSKTPAAHVLYHKPSNIMSPSPVISAASSYYAPQLKLKPSDDTILSSVSTLSRLPFDSRVPGVASSSRNLAPSNHGNRLASEHQLPPILSQQYFSGTRSPSSRGSSALHFDM